MGCHRLCIAGFLGGASDGAGGLLVADGSVRSWTTRESHMKRTVLILSAVLSTLIGCDGSESSKSSENSAASEGSSSSDKLPDVCEDKFPTFVSDADGNQVKQGQEWFCHPNGVWKAARTWEAGKQHGKATFWHENGNKKQEGENRDGKHHGK